MVKAAFTLIELLIVIAVIGVITGLTLSSLPVVQAALKHKRSETILTTLRVALETTATISGTRPSPAPHPLAGTAAPRSMFVRGALALDRTNEALEAERADGIEAGSHDRLLGPGDIFVGRSVVGDCPALFGVSREHLGIIGIATMATRHHRRIPAPSPLTDADGNGKSDPPYDATRYPDRLYLVSAGLSLTVTNGGTGYTSTPVVTVSGGGGSGTRATARVENGVIVGVTMESSGTGYTSDPIVTISGGGGSGATIVASRHGDAATQIAVEQSLGLAGRDEALHLGAVFTTTSGGSFLCDDLLWTDGSISPTWAPGHIEVAGQWHRYRIRGSALYDAWGTEILYSVSSSGAIRLESAGRDGLFRWKPGSAGYSLADLTSAVPADRDASRDNLSMVTGP